MSNTSIVLVADSNNNAIRSINTVTGQVNTFAGAPDSSGGEVDGAGTYAKFFVPVDVQVSPDGTQALVADSKNHKIRIIDIVTRAVVTIAGGTPAPQIVTAGVCGLDIVRSASRCQHFSLLLSGKIWSAEASSSSFPPGCFCIGNSVFFNTRPSSSPCGSTFPCICQNGTDSPGYTDGYGTDARFNRPSGVTFTLDGTKALVVDSFNHKIRLVILATGEVTTLAGYMQGISGFQDGYGLGAQFFYPSQIMTIPSKKTLVASGGETNVDLFYEYGYTILVTDSGNHRIRIINTSNALVTTFAGSSQGNHDGFLRTVHFRDPKGLSLIPRSGMILVADGGNNIIRTLSDGSCVLCGSGKYSFSQSNRRDPLLGLVGRIASVTLQTWAAAGIRDWKLGSDGQSCDTVCNNVGLSCSTSSGRFPHQLSQADTDALFAHNGKSCSVKNNYSHETSPMFFSNICYRNSGTTSATCSASTSSFSRLCACSNPLLGLVGSIDNSTLETWAAAGVLG